MIDIVLSFFETLSLLRPLIFIIFKRYRCLAFHNFCHTFYFPFFFVSCPVLFLSLLLIFSFPFLSFFNPVFYFITFYRWCFLYFFYFFIPAPTLLLLLGFMNFLFFLLFLFPSFFVSSSLVSFLPFLLMCSFPFPSLFSYSHILISTSLLLF